MDFKENLKVLKGNFSCSACQSQTPFVSWLGGGSNCNLTCCFWGESRGSHGSPRNWLWGGEDSGVLIAVPDDGCGGRGGSSYLSPICWLW